MPGLERSFFLGLFSPATLPRSHTTEGAEGKLRNVGASQGEAAPRPQRRFFSLGLQTLRLGSQLGAWSPRNSAAPALGQAEPPLWG